MKKVFNNILAVCMSLMIAFLAIPVPAYAEEENAKHISDDYYAASVSSSDAFPGQSDDAEENIASFSLENSIYCDGESQPVLEGTIRYTVLILDTSGSMRGKPASVQKQAAIRFCNAVTTAEGTNYVAIVRLNTSSSIGCKFTTNLDTLTSYINTIPASGGTNMEQALRRAEELLAETPDPEAGEAAIIKNVVICSDGLPENGITTEDGPYTSADNSYNYSYGNAVYHTAEELKNCGYYLYALGFFHSLSGKDLAFGRKLMTDLAGSVNQYYEVTNAEELEFVFGEIADNVTSDNFSKTGLFYYMSGDETDYTSTYYYRDDYFLKPATEYQDSLATMSMCLAFSAFGSNRTNDYGKKSQNLQYLLGECGFSGDHFATNQSYKEKPGTDSVGVGASYKTIKDGDEEYTLIAAAVRGGGYEAEWASNFTIGVNGQHQGFREARDQVLEFLGDYIDTKGISGKVKLWIVGYSRAAATTNLVAGELDDGYILSDNIELDRDNIYAYCFEAPRGALASDNVTDPKYNNIFSIINPGDIVTKVAPLEPAAFGFARYGISKFLPSALTDGQYNDKKCNMLKKYEALDSTGEYIVDNFQMKKISIANLIWDVKGFLENGIIVNDEDAKWDQNAFLDSMLTKLFAENIKNRSNYVDKYEKDIREICRIVFGSSDKMDAFQDQLISNLKSDIGRIAAQILFKRYDKLIQTIEDDIVRAMNTAGITDYSTADVNSAAGKIALLLLDFGVSHPNYTITAVYNIEGIGAAHYPELCLAWLQSFDKNYTAEGASAFGTGTYRVIHINCPVDINVYGKNGDLVASIVNDTPVALEGSSIVSYINEEGEKLIYLPATEDYTAALEATDNGSMTYSVTEYSESQGGICRIRNYYNVLLEDGEVFTGIVPAVEEEELNAGVAGGSSANYQLLDAEHNEILPDAELYGADAANAIYIVTVESNNDSYGLVYGSDAVTLGGYAAVTAIAAENCHFKGWYSDDQFISADETYRFCVTDHVELTGVFEPDEDHSVSDDDNSEEARSDDRDIATSPKTGDNTDAYLHYALLLTGIGFILLLYRKRIES